MAYNKTQWQQLDLISAERMNKIEQGIAAALPADDAAPVATSGSYNDLTDKPTIPDEYVLPTATPSTLGGVSPVAKTATMTQPVGVDSSTGRLYTAPSSGGGAGGADGFSPTATVTKSNGVATITITDKDGTSTAQVYDGAKGDTGATPNLTIGTVTTLSAGSQATATISGTAENPKLNLGIPSGPEVHETDLSTAIESALSDKEKELRFEQDENGDIVLKGVVYHDGVSPTYTLPVATASTLGGVTPVAKTSAMTQEVGVDSTGRLYTAPSSGGGTGSGFTVTDDGNGNVTIM